MRDLSKRKKQARRAVERTQYQQYAMPNNYYFYKLLKSLTLMFIKF